MSDEKPQRHDHLSMMRQQMLAAWKQAVVSGTTTRGFQDWMDDLPPADRAKYRPNNYENLDPREQWVVDMELSILDWDGS